jgi:UDP-N-acetyl-D-mannosaminuronic acid dehydrogenase
LIITHTLASKIEQHGSIKKIGVVGMGYVGIPAAALFASSPMFEKVYGFQRVSATSGYKIDMLNSGKSPLKVKNRDLRTSSGGLLMQGSSAAHQTFRKLPVPQYAGT